MFKFAGTYQRANKVRRVLRRVRTPSEPPSKLMLRKKKAAPDKEAIRTAVLRHRAQLEKVSRARKGTAIVAGSVSKSLAKVTDEPKKFIRAAAHRVEKPTSRVRRGQRAKVQMDQAVASFKNRQGDKGQRGRIQSLIDQVRRTPRRKAA